MKTTKSRARRPAEPAQKPATHDTPHPQALLDFMLRDWAAPAKAPGAMKHADVFHRRRRVLSKLFPAETLVIPTGHEKVRANDTYYRFRPGSDFYYLTGNVEPDGVLVMQPQHGGGHKDILFVEPNPGRGDATFFTDRVKGELWVGPRLGVDQSRVRFGVDECRGLPALAAFLSALRGPATHPWRTLRGFSEAADRLLPEQERDADLATALAEMRLLKDALEIAELRAVIASTKRGFEDVIRTLHRSRLAPASPAAGKRARRAPAQPASSEREVEGVFNLRARCEGNDVGYGTIAAAGAHACTLHWTKNDGDLRQGELLLLDAGVEGDSLYTADITRTLPISGRFSKEQREIYELVHAAQAAAFKQVKPGNDFMEPNRAAMRVLCQGLERLGILPTSAEEALRDDRQLYKRYSLHNVSHMLGIDVHDCAKARQEAYKYGKLRAGMVLTVEPGLYFQLDDLTVPARYRGIGVRIEDDVVVTERGMKNLSGDIPSGADEVERWIGDLWQHDEAR